MVKIMEQKKYLKFIEFIDLSLWDVKRLFLSSIKSNYSIISLKEIITERSEKEKIYQQPEEIFGILGVNNKVGIFDAYTEEGKNINQAYKKVYELDLAYNPYRVNVGSVGLKTNKNKFNYISPAYVVFSCDKEKLLSEYFYILFKTDYFNKIINENTTGSVRQNLKFSTLSEIKIPLPSLSEQNKIVEEYNNKLKQSEKAEKEAQNIEKEIENYLMEELGIEIDERKEKKKGLQFVEFKTLDKWDSFFSTGNRKQSKISLKFNSVKIKEISSLKMGSSPNSDYFNNTGKGFPFIGGASEIKNNNIEVTRFTTRPTTISKKGDLILCVRATIGKIIWSDKEYCLGRGVAGLTIDKKIVIPKYFSILLNYYEKDLQSFGTGSTFKQISKTTIEDFIIPLPPLKVQEKIVKHISELKSKIKDLKEFSENLKNSARIDFEKEIFNG
ncbi:hypothetical protein CSB09_02010 [Candidatus Gracilibacteria bacterium]|nr:MAG: hypothetical protein CSB09_02010 [Candidatus Gracilibacteria bacterium]